MAGRTAVHTDEPFVGVTVAEPFQVAVKGITFGPGATLKVPKPIAVQWAANGWILKV